VTWVYVRTGHEIWTVGFYEPDSNGGNWHADSDWHDQEAAARRVHYLNGGDER